ncbi:TIGR02710 family CRISPR-associated CARF protein [Nonomuraea endophytica]|uniref:TIGR02710 family CRISPR-associated CARF protein n=1 Tax=Nonomuraea endophytica TaxID=714136 RepID=UPI0037C8AAC9
MASPVGVAFVDFGSSDSFIESIARYRRIHQGAETYGAGSTADQATRFYLDQLINPATERARLVSDPPRAPVHLLISLCGFTPLPTILAYQLLRPQRMILIVSKDARGSIDAIYERVTRPFGPLRPQDIEHYSCDPIDPMEIYRIVKLELDRLDSMAGGRPYAVIDITGGRKVMSAAAAMAAWQLKLDLSYMEGDYDPDTRQTTPGSDRMIVLSDPNTLFGEQELARALELFRAGAFEAARQRYDEICDSIEVPGRARLLRALSEMYRAWCDLDLRMLPEAAQAVRAALGYARRDLTASHLAVLTEQLDFVQRLIDGDRNAKLLCFYVLGLHYRELDRHDFAALLFYRTIEGCLTARLTQQYPRLNPDRFDWALLDDPSAARRRYGTLTRGLGWRSGSPTPNRLTLMTSAVLLAAESDDMVARCTLADVQGLTRLQEMARKRNKSVLAHGFEAVSAVQADALHRQAADLLHAYWDLHGNGEGVDSLCQRLRFVRPDR